MPLITQVQLCTGALDRRTRECHGGLQGMRAATTVIPELIQQLRGKAGWKQKQRRGTLAPRTLGKKRLSEELAESGMGGGGGGGMGDLIKRNLHDLWA